jgi:hypothetical protein
MTDVVMFAPGFNNAGSMQALPHQPTTVMPGFMYARQTTVLSGLRFDDAPFTRLIYPRIYVSWFNAQNTFFGLGGPTSPSAVKGTFHLRFNDGNWYNWNGIIHYIVNGNPTQRTFVSWSQVEWKIISLVKI